MVSAFWSCAFHVSDRESHFKNKVMEDLERILEIKHHFCLPNLHWPNGTIERQNREVLFVLRALTSEFLLNFTDWPDILPMANWALNHAIQPVHGYAPVTIFTGLPPSRPLDCVYSSGTKVMATLAKSSISADALESMMERLSNELS